MKLLLAAALLFQCPDGSPPPCGRPATHAAIPAAPERGRHFLILPFRNLSHAPDQDWLVEGSTTMLGEALGRWQEIQVVPDERLYPALHRAGLVPGTVMDDQRIRRLASETGGWTAVTGEVISSGGRIRVSARAVDVPTGRELVRASADVPSTGDVRQAFDGVATQLLPAAGLPTGSAGSAAPPTHSLDAYRAYLRGMAELHRSHYRQARDAMLDAIRIDSTFAQAYAVLAQSLLFINPMTLLDATSGVQRYAARGAALAAQLPEPQRTMVIALNDMFRGQVTESRALLERALASDSDDVSVLGQLSLLEWGDPILVPVGAGMRPRGSLNRSAQLSRRILQLDPSQHAIYLPITLSFLYAGGDLPGLIVGVRHEGASFRDMVLGGPRMFAPLYRSDTLSLVPVDSLGLIAPDSITAWQRRALAAARSWSDQWLSVGRDEAEAHLTASRVAHRQGDLPRALAELDTAVAMGIESGISSPTYPRITILARMGRYDEARARADSLLAAGRFDHLLPLPSEWIEAQSWSFNLWLMHGDADRAQAVVSKFAESLRSFGILGDSTMAAVVAMPILAGNPVPPFFDLHVPAAFRATVMDSLWTKRGSLPTGSTIALILPSLQRMASAAGSADSNLAARVRSAPWFMP